MDTSTLAAFERSRSLAHQTVSALCYAPFANLFLDRKGDARVCCWNWRVPVGNVLHNTMDEIWNGPVINHLRTAVSRHDFAHGCDFCKFQTADGVFGGAKMTQFDRFVVDSPTPPGPKQIEFSISNVCNLQCVMCDGEHSSAIRAHREHRSPMAHVYSDAFLESLRPYLKSLALAKFLGGEPFLVAEHFRLWDMIIEDGLPTPCHVTTNATQYNDRVCHYMEHIPFSFAVSLDAATKETYEAIRVNASFEEVMQNCKRFREYCRQRRTNFCFTYCLMRSNWQEFGAFCLMADAWDAYVGINSVVHPASMGLYTMQSHELRLVQEGLERQADEMGRCLTLNKRVWFDEVERIRAKVRAAERAPAGETVLWQVGAFSSGADADRSAVFQDIGILKMTKVNGDVPYLPPDATDIRRHFAKLKPSFIGKPRLSFELAKLIVLIRRGIAVEHNVSLFFGIMGAEIDFLLGTLATRWLLSVADTYADHGTPVQQATAAMIVSLFNMVKLTETERLLVADNKYDQNKIESLDHIREKKEVVELWDGMRAYSIRSGDMPSKMIGRMRRIASGDKVLFKILETLLERALCEPTILSRLSSYNSKFMPEDWRPPQ